MKYLFEGMWDSTSSYSSVIANFFEMLFYDVLPDMALTTAPMFINYYRLTYY